MTGMQIQVTFRRIITMVSFNRLKASGRFMTGCCISAIITVILALNASAIAQNDSREIVDQKVNIILQSIRGPNEPQTGGMAKSAAVTRFSKTEDGYLRFIGAPPAHDFPVTSVIHGNAQVTAKNFLIEHSVVFGIRSSKVDFVTKKAKTRGGRSHVRFQQTYANIPVFAAEIIVQLNDVDGVEYVLSDIISDTKSLDTGELASTPDVSPEEAQQVAVNMMAQENPGLEFKAEEPNLMIYYPPIVGNTGKTRLVWQTTVVSLQEPLVAEFVLVDAHTAEIALHYSLMRNAEYRKVYDANNTSANPGTLCREEWDPPSGETDCDKAYDYLGDTYDFYYNYHGRDSIDSYGMIMSATVRYCNPGDSCPWPNAGWGSVSERMYFGEGYVVDDVAGHELTHGVTDHESGLIYQNESGAIDESFADMWGEWIDQTNGKGNDTSAVKWLIGEDLPDGAIRDMKNPPFYGDPDRMGSPYWYPGSGDNGGVHTNCGVNNKLCYLLTDGGTFNGHTVTGMGIAGVADLYYEVQTNLLSSGADYADLYSALTQAAINIEWTSTEKQNLEEACQAVEIVGDDCPATEYSTNISKTIADLATTTSTIVISQAGTITDINVKLNITHSWDADLDVFLIAPDETRVELFTDVGSSGDNFSNTILDDEAATAITSGTAPFAGSYRPEGSLAVLDGKSITGTWTLEVTDDTSGDIGTLNSWSLIIKTPCGSECQTIEDYETGDFSTFPWIRSGNANWTITSSDKNTGTYCAKAGTIGDSQSTSLEVTLDCVAGDIKFYRKVSSESGYDYLKFYIDGVLKGSWSGTQNWAQVSYPVSAGSRTFKWTYSKDGSFSSGSDTAWIDDIEFPVFCGIIGDFDGDGNVDTADLGILCASWLTNDPLTDIVSDSIINFLDFAAFVENWMK